MKRYTRHARSNAMFDRRDYEQTAPDGTSLFCRRKLLTETAMDLANRATRSDAGCHIALSGMRALIEEVDMVNEEEEEAAKLKKQRNTSMTIMPSKLKILNTSELVLSKRNNSSTSCFKHKRKKERGRRKPEKGGMQGEK